MSLLLGQMFSKCNMATIPEDQELQLMFAERYSLAMAPDTPLPTGHWGGSSQDSASTFYGYLASLSHVRSTNVFNRHGTEITLTDRGFKTLSCIDTNSVTENTCQVSLETSDDFGGFCFYRITGEIYLSFGFQTSFHSDSEDYPILTVNLYAGRGGTTTPLQTWNINNDLIAYKDEEDVAEMWSYDWASQIVQLKISDDVIDIVSNRWNGAIVEFIAAPNGWSSSNYHGGSDGDTATAGVNSQATCLPDSDIGSSNTVNKTWVGGDPKDTIWESISEPFDEEFPTYTTEMPTEGNSTGYIEVGLEKPTIGPKQWGGLIDWSGTIPENSGAPGINALGYWDPTGTDAENGAQLQIDFVGQYPRVGGGSATGREWVVTVKAGSTLVKEITWEDYSNPWDDESTFIATGNYVQYRFTEAEWTGASSNMSRSDQENLTVKIEISGYDASGGGYDEDYVGISRLAIKTTSSAWMGIYMAKGSNTGTYPEWTGYSTPDNGLAEYYGSEGVNRLCLMENVNNPFT